MSEEKKQDFEFQELVNYREQVTNNMNYSIQRIDILIIALCTSGIVLGTTILNSSGGQLEMKWALLFFFSSIVLNLVSQFIGYYSNRRLVEVYNQKVVDYKDNPEAYDEDKYELAANGAHRLGVYVNGMNITSFLALVAGMVCCLLYYYCRS